MYWKVHCPTNISRKETPQWSYWKNFMQREFLNKKSQTWVQQPRILYKISKTWPQAVFECLISRCKHRFTYYIWTIPRIGNIMSKIYDFVTNDLIPATKNGITCSIVERKLLVLSPKMGKCESRYLMKYQI